MKENIIKSKSFAFAIRIVKLCKSLREQEKEFVLSKQLLHSGTAVGALVREAEHAESKKDFIHKLAIAQKENNETLYWLELLHRTEYLNQELFESLHNDALETLKLITCILKTSKANITNG